MHEPFPEPQHPLFRVESSRRGTTPIVAVHGELDVATTSALARAAGDAIAAEPETVVIDLAAVTFMDSSAVRLLVGVHRRVREARIRLVLVPAPEPVQRIFRICGLGTRLPFAPPPPAGGGAPRLAVVRGDAA